MKTDFIGRVCCYLMEAMREFIDGSCMWGEHTVLSQKLQMESAKNSMMHYEMTAVKENAKENAKPKQLLQWTCLFFIVQMCNLSFYIDEVKYEFAFSSVRISKFDKAHKHF